MDLREYVNNNKAQIQKYRKYLKDIDWSIIEVFRDDGSLNEKVTYERRMDEWKLQKAMADSVLKRLTVLTKKYFQDRKESPYKTFLKNSLEVINIHIDRSDLYDSNIDLISNSSEYIRQMEMDLSNKIFTNNAELRDKLSELNLTLGDEAGNVEFHADSKAPLVMHEKLCVMYPQIREKVKALGVDFESEPEPKFFIHDPNPPEWDTTKHYFDQDAKTLQYYVDEIKKIKNGIILDGVYISPWMYYHINFFVTKFPTTFTNPKTGKIESVDVTTTPPLRDNEWWVINDNYELAKDRGEMMFLAATRRAGKSTMQTSHLGVCVIQGKLELIVAGGSSKDLDVLQKNFEILQLNTHPALRVPFLLEDWGKRVELGIKTKQNKTILNSFLKIINMDGGANSKSEVFAGITPDAVIIDEIMKLKFKSQLEGLKPALDAGEGGKRCVAILAGTAGSSELAKDAFDILRFPTESDVLNMPWEKFNNMVPEEFRTWKERDFGTFIPAQMSMKKGMIKIESNLADFLGIDSDKLRDVKINLTDWRGNFNSIKEDREAKKRDLELYTKEVLYYPTCPSDMLLSGKINPFPVTEAIMHKEYILQKGGCIGRKVFLSQDPTGKIKASDTNAPLPDYPFGGGYIDSPVVLYEDLPENQPADHLYVAGCLTEGQKVLTNKGLKNVEDVEDSDRLISKDGDFVRIKTFFKHERNNSNVFKFKIGNTFRETVFTEEHPIYVTTPIRYTEGISKGRLKNFNLESFEFRRADEVKEGDWIKYPNIYRKKQPYNVDSYWKQVKNCKYIDSPLNSRDFWYFIGMYLGDGWVESSKNKIGIIFNEKETVSINSIKTIVENIFKAKVSFVKRPGSITLYFSSKVVSEFLNNNFDKGALNKKIPEWVKYISEEFKYDLLMGYLNSDGCFMNLPNGYLLTEFVSISLELLEGFQDILLSLGLVSSLTKLRDSGTREIIKGVISKTKETYMLRVNQIDTLKMYRGFRKDLSQKHPKVLKELKNEVKSKHTCFLSKDLDYVYFRVRKINIEKYTGTVYNFECETNTFLTHHITTHNCDDYKQDESGTDSVGSFHIYKVDVGFDKNCGKIVASLATRPDPHGKFHHQMYMLQQAFNAKCFMENADMDYKAYLERMHVADRWLMTSLDFDGDMTREGASSRKYGWTPTPKNKKFLLSLLINYCKRTFTEYDEDGNPFQVLGVQKIDDVGLLSEIIAYTDTANVDRCTSFMSCLGYEFYLNANYLLPNLNTQVEQRREQTKKIIKSGGNPFFGKSKPKKYF